ncbi:MAG: restriction endonuclease [Halopenitus sp.]
MSQPVKEKDLKPGITLEDLAEKQRKIAQTAIEHPELTHKQVAEKVDSHRSYVSEVHQRFLNEHVIPERVVVDNIDEDIYESIYAGLQARRDVEKVEKHYDLERGQGDPKEIDVAVWLTKSGYDFLVIVECKFHEDPVEQGVISEMIRHVNNSKADKSVVVSWSGFQSGAITEAEDSNTELYTLTEAAEENVEHLEDRIWRVSGEIKINPPPEYEIVDINLNPLTEVDRDQIPGHVLNQNPRLYDENQSPTDETIFSYLRKVAQGRGPGRYSETIGDRLLLLEGDFFLIESMTYEITSPDGDPVRREFEVDALEDHDLILIDELADPGEDIEFFTIREALEAFLESAN